MPPKRRAPTTGPRERSAYRPTASPAPSERRTTRAASTAGSVAGGAAGRRPLPSKGSTSYGAEGILDLDNLATRGQAFESEFDIARADALQPDDAATPAPTIGTYGDVTVELGRAMDLGTHSDLTHSLNTSSGDVSKSYGDAREGGIIFGPPAEPSEPPTPPRIPSRYPAHPSTGQRARGSAQVPKHAQSSDSNITAVRVIRRFVVKNPLVIIGLFALVASILSSWGFSKLYQPVPASEATVEKYTRACEYANEVTKNLESGGARIEVGAKHMQDAIYAERDEFTSVFRNVSTMVRDYYNHTKTVYSYINKAFEKIEQLITFVETQVEHVDKQVEHVDRQVEYVNTILTRIENVDSVQATHLISNLGWPLETINWFSPGYGPTIEYGSTSPTKKIDRNLVSKAWVTLFSRVKAKGPMHALTGWTEPNDRWCAADSEHGKLQLAISLELDIYPTKFTIEHMPKAASLDIENAPKTLEVWAFVREKKDLDEINLYRSERALPACSDFDAKNPGWACLGVFEYNIHRNNHIQIYDFNVLLQNFDLHTRKFVIRVTENWGGDRTCLYRIRMHGEPGYKV